MVLLLLEVELEAALVVSVMVVVLLSNTLDGGVLEGCEEEGWEGEEGSCCC